MKYLSEDNLIQLAQKIEKNYLKVVAENIITASDLDLMLFSKGGDMAMEKVTLFIGNGTAMRQLLKLVKKELSKEENESKEKEDG